MCCARRAHIEACMACTEGMGIAASRSSVDDCMACPKLASIAEDVAAQKRIAIERGNR